MQHSMQYISFGCCLEDSLKDINIDNSGQLYSVTKHCAVYLNETNPDSDSFITMVYSFYKMQEKNETVSCFVNYCKEGTKHEFIAYVAFWVCVFFIGCLGNIFVLMAFNRSKKLRKNPSTNFVASLAVSDLLVVLFLIPYKAHDAFHNHHYCAPPIICKLYLAFDVTFFVASITHLYAIAIDRFIAITKPYRYKGLATLSCVKKTIVLIWIYSSFWGVLLNINFKNGTSNKIENTESHLCNTNNGVFTIIAYIIIFFVPCFVMFLLYSKMLLISYKHAKNINTTKVSSIEDFIRQSSFGISHLFSNHKLELRATKVVFIIYGTFFACWCPVIVVIVANAIKHDTVKSNVTYVLFGEMLPIINSILNPFIYGVLHRDFKKSLKRIFRGMHSKLQITLSPLQHSFKSQSSLGRLERVAINETSK
ncbi:alpha-2Db adrenergic receptor-like [Hydra vulgaris]|uniref:alpha-2Db adrenergic receptor-like n=1 Tax=Hydra vulgaris TaxID=6087 RepID=UPI0006416B03|nr:alpha-2Db adrenergic receptor [Hydra vulgaris]